MSTYRGWIAAEGYDLEIQELNPVRGVEGNQQR